jgi:hypothetical protein
MTLHVLGFLFSEDLERIFLIEKEDESGGYLSGFEGKMSFEDKTPLDAIIRIFYEYSGIPNTYRVWHHRGTVKNNEDEFVIFMGISSLENHLLFDEVMNSSLADNHCLTICDPFSVSYDSTPFMTDIIEKLASGKFF